MLLHNNWTKLGAVILGGVMIAIYFKPKSEVPKLQTEEIAVEEKLRNHSKVFNKPSIIKATDGVHVAIGYGISNMIMIEGNFNPKVVHDI